MEVTTSNLSLRANKTLLDLFSEAQKYQPLLSRVEILNHAVEYALGFSVDWKTLSEKSRNPKEAPDSQNDNRSPMFIQIRVNSEQWTDVTNQIKNSFNPPLKRITTPYAVRLVLENFVGHLAKLNKDETGGELNDERSAKTTEHNDLSDFETVRRIVQIISLNREADKHILEAIKSILKTWVE